jgi:AraC-like DNA-binding protein
LLDACARLGLDTQRILAAAQLDADALQDPDARLPIEQVEILWRSAYEISGDPDLSLHAIEVLPFGAYRVVDLLASSAPTIGTALTKVADYFPLINTAVRLRYEIGHAEVSYAVEAPSRPSVLTRAYAEYVLAAVVLRTRAAAREPFQLQRVEFSHPRPANTREHERIFACPVAFDADTTRLVIAREVWEAPCGEGATLFSVLDAHAQLLFERLPPGDDLVEHVGQAVKAELRGGSPELPSIARRLAMSPRTLQRRLKQHGIRFETLLDAARFRAAQAYLAERDIAASEVAYLLGFAGQSAFNRAFKRWSGQTPTEYRRTRLSRQGKTLTRAD